MDIEAIVLLEAHGEAFVASARWIVPCDDDVHKVIYSVASPLESGPASVLNLLKIYM